MAKCVVRNSRLSQIRCMQLTQAGRITFTVLTFRLIVKEVLPKGLASNSGEAMMTNIEIIHLLRARVTRDGTICAKNSTFGYFDGTNPIT